LCVEIGNILSPLTLHKNFMMIVTKN